MAPPGPNIGIGVFLFRSHEDHRILLGKRKGSLGHGTATTLLHIHPSPGPAIQANFPLSGTYSLSGGHLEHGETFAECAKREVREETGLEIEDVKFFTAVENFFEGEGKRHYVTIFVTAFVVGEKEAEVSVSSVLLWFAASLHA